jgi:hypothetical protein
MNKEELEWIVLTRWVLRIGSATLAAFLASFGAYFLAGGVAAFHVSKEIQWDGENKELFK